MTRGAAMEINKEFQNGNGNHDHEPQELYGEEGISSQDAPVPFWLKCNYVFWVIFGIIWFCLFWNGSTVSFFDRGYWHELQQAANTTFQQHLTQENKSTR